MKKLLISIGSLLIMTFVIVLFVNASDSKKDPKKAKTEVKKVDASTPCSATCGQSTGEKAATCDPAKCKEMNCDHKDGKCDPATCTANKDCAKKEAMVCKPATACPATCPSKAAEAK